MQFDLLSLQFDPLHPEVQGAQIKETHLSDLEGYFVDEQSYQQELASDNPLIYQVSTWTVQEGDGDLMCGFGTLMPGKIGEEYFFTRGHYHEWREAAEIYIGLSGEGCMLLEHETSGESKLLPLSRNCMVYVPGCTAHRTINVGTTPLTYIGIYPVNAGHDYGALRENNFECVVVAENGQSILMKRSEYLTKLEKVSHE